MHLGKTTQIQLAGLVQDPGYAILSLSKPVAHLLYLAYALHSTVSLRIGKLHLSDISCRSSFPLVWGPNPSHGAKHFTILHPTERRIACTGSSESSEEEIVIPY